MLKIVTSIIFLSFIFSCNRNIVYPEKKEVTTLKLDQDIYTYTNYMMKSKEEGNKAKYAIYKNKFKVGIFDKNNNGKLNDIGEDILFITSIHDEFANVTPEITYAANYLEQSNSIQFNYEILFLNVGQNNEIEIIKQFIDCGTFNKTVSYQDTLALISVWDTKNKEISIDTLKKSKPLLITFYASWCQPCLDKLDQLAKEKNLPYDVLVLADEENQLQASIDFYNRKQYPWKLGIADKHIKKLFHQNGFPYNVYINHDNRIITDQFEIAELLSR